MTIQQMKDAIIKVYDTASWRKKVYNMYDDQVVAIYYNFSNRGILDKVLKRERPVSVYKPIFKEENKIENTKPKETYQQQLSIFDFINE